MTVIVIVSICSNVTMTRLLFIAEQYRFCPDHWWHFV